MICTKSDSMWDRVTSILVSLHASTASDWSMSDHALLAYFRGCDGICLWNCRPTKVLKRLNIFMRKYTSCSTQNQSKSLREIKNKRLHNGKKKTLSALYLAEILQQRVWNVGESRGKFREDSGATPLDFKTPCGGQIQLPRPPSSSSGSSPSLPATNRPRGSNFTQQHTQHS